MKNKKCEKCEVIYNGKQCPVCGTVSYSKKIENNGKPKRRFYKKWWFWAIIIFFIVIFINTFISRTTELRNAVETANSLIEKVPYSRAHLIEALEREGFSHEDSVYGADYCDAYWDEQAARAAKQYIEDSDEEVSLNDLLNKLEDDGFIGRESIYAAEQNGFFE